MSKITVFSKQSLEALRDAFNALLEASADPKPPGSAPFVPHDALLMVAIRRLLKEDGYVVSHPDDEGEGE